MLTLYLCPQSGVHYQPSNAQLEAWLISVTQGGLVGVNDLTLHPIEVEPDQEGQSLEWTLSPGLGVGQLFNQDARDALLPAELTFESLGVSRVRAPQLLPPELSDRVQHCPQCGDELEEPLLKRALQQQAFTPFDQLTAFCRSCQDEIPLKRLEFEPDSRFAKFWITLTEVGSSRLNPALLRDWETRLGCRLIVLIDQYERDLDEISMNRRASDLWSNFEDEHGEESLAEQLGVAEASGRGEYRRQRYLRRAQGSNQRRDGRSGKRRRRSSNKGAYQKWSDQLWGDDE